LNYAGEGNWITPNPAYPEPPLLQRIMSFDPKETLGPILSPIKLRFGALAAKARQKYASLNMRQLKMPAIKKLGHGLKPRKKLTQHWVFWFFIFLIPLIGMTFFMGNKQPMTSHAPSANQLESNAPPETSPAFAEKESTSAFAADKSYASTQDKKMPRHHIIQAGETLSSIARKYEISVEAITSENNLQNHLIYIGQILRIPVAGGIGSKSG
jgi:LysM repeat protein